MTEKREEPILLSEEHVYFGGMTLTYQLRMHHRRAYRFFSVRIRLLREFGEAELGTDLMRAVALYQSLIDGAVTPCALEDVLRKTLYA